jgi:hypothetical protein
MGSGHAFVILAIMQEVACNPAAIIKLCPPETVILAVCAVHGVNDVAVILASAFSVIGAGACADVNSACTVAIDYLPGSAGYIFKCFIIDFVHILICHGFNPPFIQVPLFVGLVVCFDLYIA